jgi:hypothetical protein
MSDSNSLSGSSTEQLAAILDGQLRIAYEKSAFKLIDTLNQSLGFDRLTFKDPQTIPKEIKEIQKLIVESKAIKDLKENSPERHKALAKIMAKLTKQIQLLRKNVDLGNAQANNFIFQAEHALIGLSGLMISDYAKYLEPLLNPTGKSSDALSQLKKSLIERIAKGYSKSSADSFEQAYYDALQAAGDFPPKLPVENIRRKQSGSSMLKSSLEKGNPSLSTETFSIHSLDKKEALGSYTEFLNENIHDASYEAYYTQVVLYKKMQKDINEMADLSPSESSESRAKLFSQYGVAELNIPETPEGNDFLNQISEALGFKNADALYENFTQLSEINYYDGQATVKSNEAAKKLQEAKESFIKFGQTIEQDPLYRIEGFYTQEQARIQKKREADAKQKNPSFDSSNYTYASTINYVTKTLVPNINFKRSTKGVLDSIPKEQENAYNISLVSDMASIIGLNVVNFALPYLTSTQTGVAGVVENAATLEQTLTDTSQSIEESLSKLRRQKKDQVQVDTQKASDNNPTKPKKKTDTAVNFHVEPKVVKQKKTSPSTPTDSITKKAAAILDGQLRITYEQCALKLFETLNKGLECLNFGHRNPPEEIIEIQELITDDLEKIKQEDDPNERHEALKNLMSDLTKKIKVLRETIDLDNLQANNFIFQADRAFNGLSGFMLSEYAKYLEPFVNPAGKPSAESEQTWKDKVLDSLMKAGSKSFSNSSAADFEKNYHEAFQAARNLLQNAPVEVITRKPTPPMLQSALKKGGHRVSTETVRLHAFGGKASLDFSTKLLNRNINETAFDSYYTQIVFYKKMQNDIKKMAGLSPPESRSSVQAKLFSEFGFEELNNSEANNFLNQISVALGFDDADAVYDNYTLLSNMNESIGWGAAKTLEIAKKDFNAPVTDKQLSRLNIVEELFSKEYDRIQKNRATAAKQKNNSFDKNNYTYASTINYTTNTLIPNLNFKRSTEGFLVNITPEEPETSSTPGFKSRIGLALVNVILPYVTSTETALAEVVENARTLEQTLSDASRTIKESLDAEQTKTKDELQRDRETYFDKMLTYISKTPDDLVNSHAEFLADLTDESKKQIYQNDFEALAALQVLEFSAPPENLAHYRGDINKRITELEKILSEDTDSLSGNAKLTSMPSSKKLSNAPAKFSTSIKDLLKIPSPTNKQKILENKLREQQVNQAKLEALTVLQAKLEEVPFKLSKSKNIILSAALLDKFEEDLPELANLIKTAKEAKKTREEAPEASLLAADELFAKEMFTIQQKYYAIQQGLLAQQQVMLAVSDLDENDYRHLNNIQKLIRRELRQATKIIPDVFFNDFISIHYQNKINENIVLFNQKCEQFLLEKYIKPGKDLKHTYEQLLNLRSELKLGDLDKETRKLYKKIISAHENLLIEAWGSANLESKKLMLQEAIQKKDDSTVSLLLKNVDITIDNVQLAQNLLGALPLPTNKSDISPAPEKGKVERIRGMKNMQGYFPSGLSNLIFSDKYVDVLIKIRPAFVMHEQLQKELHREFKKNSEKDPSSFEKYAEMYTKQSERILKLRENMVETVLTDTENTAGLSIESVEKINDQIKEWNSQVKVPAVKEVSEIIKSPKPVVFAFHLPPQPEKMPSPGSPSQPAPGSPPQKESEINKPGTPRSGPT